uniref:Uncharacterized protein n=1 Tax=Solanum tuberosum TaxID=4113 RepID=M1DWV1_SOLTU
MAMGGALGKRLSESVSKLIETRNVTEVRDCDIYILAYVEWLFYGQGNSAGNFDAVVLRSRYAALLWNYGQQKNDVGDITDSEALQGTTSLR